MTEQEHIVNELARAFAKAINTRLAQGLPALPAVKPKAKKQAWRPVRCGWHFRGAA